MAAPDWPKRLREIAELGPAVADGLPIDNPAELLGQVNKFGEQHRAVIHAVACEASPDYIPPGRMTSWAAATYRLAAAQGATLRSIRLGRAAPYRIAVDELRDAIHVLSMFLAELASELDQHQRSLN